MSDALQEYFDAGDNGETEIYGGYYYSQSFTAASNYTITSVSLLLYKSYGSPGSLTVSIRAVDVNDLPTGGDLDTATTDGDTLPTGSPYEWREFVFSTGVSLTMGMHYAIVIRDTDLNYSGFTNWRFVSDTDPYPTGKSAYSNGGSSWTNIAGRDYLFKNYGLVPPIEISGSCSAIGSMTGLAYLATWPISGGCSAIGMMSGFAFSDVLPVVGSCSAQAGMTGYAFASVFIIGGCSAEASMTGIATAFSYIIGSMSATAIMLGDLGFLPVLVRPRRADYDPDKFWDEETKTWIDSVTLSKRAGGRHKSFLIVVSDQNEIYIGGI